MNGNAAAFNIEPFETAARNLCRPFAGFGDMPVLASGFSSGEPGRGSVSTSTLTQAAAESLRRAGVRPGSDREIKIKKTGLGLPFICLSERVQKQAAAAGIGRILVSATNDCGVELCVAAAAQNGTALHGIGIDLLFYTTAEHLLAGCPPEELQLMFTQNEIREASAQPDESAAVRTFLAMVPVKEAVFKAVSEAFWRSGSRPLSEEETERTSFLDVEVSGTGAAVLNVRLLNSLRDIAEISGVCEIRASTVSGSNYTGAVALAVGGAAAA